MTKSPLEAADTAYCMTQNGYGRFIVGNNWKESLDAACKAYLKAFLQNVDMEKLQDIIQQKPLNISSTRRSGENGLRNADELAQAVINELIKQSEGK